ncbi:hypothetical protein ACLRGF_05480 [Mycetocola zhadangensis]|uniref:hypothetical protein n=1 Tax=Mycetocola zhadangensis TaxID=1164595 RepID=UPI003A4D44F4
MMDQIAQLAAAETESYLLGSRLLETAITLVLGAVLGIGGQLLLDARKGQVEDYELWVDVREASQKAEGIGRLNTGLSLVAAGDRVVTDPYVVDFYVWGVGKRDVRTEQFDGQDLEFHLNVPIIDELEGSTQGNLESARFSFDKDGVVRLAPSLVRARAAKRYRFLTDGKPQLEMVNPVADLNIFDFSEQWQKPTKGQVVAKRLAITLTTLAVLAFIGSIIISLVRYSIEGPPPPTLISSDDISIFGVPDSELEDLPWGILLVPIFVFLTFGLFSYGAAPSRRPRRAKRLLDDNLEPSGAPALKTHNG